MADEEVRELSPEELSPQDRLVPAIVLGTVLSAPLLLGVLYEEAGLADPRAIQMTLGWALGFTTWVLSIPWCLPLAGFGVIAGASGHLAIGLVLTLAPAWALNAGFALRKFRFRTLMWISAIFAGLQSLFFVAAVRGAPLHP